MIRAITCAALALGLVACGSSGPKRPSVPSDPALVPLTYGGTVNEYLDRTYGSTNINRFRHGFMLLKIILMDGQE